MATLNDALNFMQEWTGCRQPHEALEILGNSEPAMFTEFVCAALNKGAVLAKAQNVSCQPEQYMGLSDTIRRLASGSLSVSEATSVYCAAKELNVDALALGRFVVRERHVPVSKKRYAYIGLDAETQQPVSCTKQRCGHYLGELELLPNRVWKPCKYVAVCTLKVRCKVCAVHDDRTKLVVGERIRKIIYVNEFGVPTHCTNTSCIYEVDSGALDPNTGAGIDVAMDCEYYQVCKLRYLSEHNPTRY